MTNSNVLPNCLLFKDIRVSMKSPGLQLCPHHASLCTGIRSCKYKCLVNVPLFTFITKSLNQLYIGLFVARNSNSLEIDNFLESIVFNFFLKFRQFWPKYFGTVQNWIFLSQIITRITVPLSPYPMLKKLVGNTSDSFVNTL